MIRDLRIPPGSFVVDAGCGPGMWTPLLADTIGSHGQIMGVDISTESLMMAQDRCANTQYQHQVRYTWARLEQPPIEHGTADLIFSANVSQYLADPVSIFAALGPYLVKGGRLVVKDIDFGTMRFSCVDPGLQARVLQARERWEAVRVHHGYTFEDSWVGSKLAGYLRAAGYQDVLERPYRIVRHHPLPINYRIYLQGIAEWFVCEGAPYLCAEDVQSWRQCFFDASHSVLDQPAFFCEETEFVVSGVWDREEHTSSHFFSSSIDEPHTEKLTLPEHAY